MKATAWHDGHRTLYHWQRYDESRLADILLTQRVYCSNPGAFNDPWDCKPHFNSGLLSEPDENERHVQWAVDICRRNTPMSEQALESMRTTLLTDPVLAAELIDQNSRELGSFIDKIYRVYCLGPDVGNLLMWSHYADNHRGVCLEFNLHNDVMCGALRCQYLQDFPIMRLYETSEEANLQILLAKSEVWSYEREYRLVALERGAMNVEGTLVTDNNFLQLPVGALQAVIAGCQAEYNKIHKLVSDIAPQVIVKRAMRVQNRYQLAIVG